MDSSGEGISVAIRMRPLNDREINGGQSSVFRVKHNSVEQLTKEGQPIEGQTYNYNQVFGEAAGNKDVYTGIAKDVVKGVVGGINGTIFAYGQTSSGKTHTMLGGGNEPGVLEMAATEIFERIAQCDNREFLMRVSFVEIYNELIYDLLCDSKDDALINIREDPRRGVYCEATEKIITDYESITKALHRGMSRRTVESTAMNETSSRSHSIFKLVVESRQKAAEGSEEPDGAVLVASLTLVDLAGSESVKHTQAAGQRAKEGGKINQSLLSLSRVIHSLSQPGAHVAYRDSKLTRLLQPSLSGNAKMCIVCCVTSAEK
jgi:centromeric protein E